MFVDVTHLLMKQVYCLCVVLVCVFVHVTQVQTVHTIPKQVYMCIVPVCVIGDTNSVCLLHVTHLLRKQVNTCIVCVCVW